MRKTTKILLAVFVCTLGVITFLSVATTASLNFKKFTEKKDVINIGGIKYLHAEGPLYLYLNSSEQGEGHFPSQANKDLGFQQKGDTLFVYNRKSASAPAGFLEHCDDLVQIKANNSSIIIYSLKKENISIEANNSTLNIPGGKVKKGLIIAGRSNSRINLYGYRDTLTVNLMDKAQLISFDGNGVIKGEIRNKSIIDLYSGILAEDSFVKKDSAVVIFR